MNTNIITFITLIIFTMSVNAQETKTLHSFKVNDIYGEEFDLAQLNGKKVLVVNTASKCGLTPQYKELEALFKEYGGENFTIIGFPANNFMNQEPGTEEEIIEFCEINYGVTFPMMSKISVKGDDMHPVYQWLTSKDENGVMDSKVKWNFQKYLINEDGTLADVVDPKKSPKSEEIVDWIASN
jgi:glutathione peroxidase